MIALPAAATPRGHRNAWGGRGMVGHPAKGLVECVVLDLNTQRDFLERGGAHPVANLESLLPTLRRLVAWAKRNHAPIVSSIDAHRTWELKPTNEPIHCLDHSLGQRKVAFTLCHRCAAIEFDNTLSVPEDLFSRFQQVIFRKRDDDLLDNPKADRFLTQLPAAEFIIFGNSLERSVKMLALGLLARGKRISVVVDACGFWSRSKAELAVRQMQAKGATLLTVDELISRKLSRRRRYYRRHPRAMESVDGDRPAPRNGNGRARNGRGLPGRNGDGTIPDEK